MKKIGLICLALVLALGALGVGAALWMGVLTIHGDVITGSVDAVWSIESVYDNEEKDVSFIEAEIIDPWFMQITIINAYPSVTYTVDWDIMCTGSVPIHFAMPDIISDLPPLATFTFTDMEGNIIDWLGLQLHPGEVIYGKLTVHLENDAEQGMIYMFDIMLPFGQYNEFPPAM
jgi:hypothetical protein